MHDFAKLCTNSLWLLCQDFDIVFDFMVLINSKQIWQMNSNPQGDWLNVGMNDVSFINMLV